MSSILSGLGFIWNSLFYHPIVNLILLIYKLTGHDLGISIILLTVLVRFILWPLMKSQIDAVKKTQALKPKLDAIKKTYKDDKKKLQEAQLQIYKENGVNPAGSCLPLIVQLPFIYSLYSVIRTIATSKTDTVFNNVAYSHFLMLTGGQKFNTTFLGLNLAKDAATIGFHSIIAVAPYIILSLLVGASQYFASKASLPETRLDTTAAVEQAESKGNKQNKLNKSLALKEEPKKEEFDPEQLSKAITMQMLYFFPLLLTWISLGFSGGLPVALSLYWVVQSAFIVFQTSLLQHTLPWKKTNQKK